MKKDLGGQRIGSGSKMEVAMRNYERSTHNQSRIWRSTMAPGVLVPFLTEIGTNGDTIDVDLNTLTRTLPTNGPLFGSFKMQLDVFTVPIRLYNSQLHNNKLGIGMNMSNIKLPMMKLEAPPLIFNSDTPIELQQINPSSLLAYTGIRGLGKGDNQESNVVKDRNALMILAYYDIFKNYYANKQEENAFVIGIDGDERIEYIPDAVAYNDFNTNSPVGVNKTPETNETTVLNIEANELFTTYGLLPEVLPTDIIKVQWVDVTGGGAGIVREETATYVSQISDSIELKFNKNITINMYNPQWIKIIAYKDVDEEIVMKQFVLDNIDEMREDILAHKGNSPYYINDFNKLPYTTVTNNINDNEMVQKYPMAGLCAKTYQSDLFNNWLSTEWIDGTNGINEITAIDTSEGYFNIDTLNLAKKVYDMLNRIAVSGGSYDDWQEAVYSENAVRKAETPIYAGGMSCEIVFDEVVSTADAQAQGNDVALGSLAGRGTQRDRKGGNIYIKIKEPSVIMGIVSLTPRIDYSQGNRWYTRLETVDDLHKPALDGIGFQELITEQMAFWENEGNTETGETFYSAGKQPAWLNYMTAYNETFGNFADRDKEMFMTLNRNYECKEGRIGDLTTYIDPNKYNYAFANASLEAQNFWVQIGVNMTTRRKISAKIIPNL